MNCSECGMPAPTMRDLLDAAAAYVTATRRLGPRQAKAYVHAAPLAEVFAYPAVRDMAAVRGLHHPELCTLASNRERTALP